MFRFTQSTGVRSLALGLGAVLLCWAPAVAQREASPSPQVRPRSGSSSPPPSSTQGTARRSPSSSSASSNRGTVTRRSGSSSSRRNSSTPDSVYRGRSGDSGESASTSGLGHRDSDRDRRGRGRTARSEGGRRTGNDYRYPYYYGGYGGYYGYDYPHYSGYYGYPYGYGSYLSFRLHEYAYPYYYPFGWGNYAHPRARASRHDYRNGALDLDLKPDKAEVYVDGRYVGLVDQFDGFPDYLWLAEGDYDVAVYSEGFETFSRQVRVRPATILRIKERMKRGQAVRPEAVSPLLAEPLPAEELAMIRLSVFPNDAAIYLDGRLVGRADEVSVLGDLVAGEHLLQVVRPGHLSRELAFSIDAGEEVDLEFELEEDSGP